MNLWRPLDEKNLVNPYPMYDEIMAQGGIYQAHTGEFIVTKYDLVEQILKDQHTFRVGNSKEWIERGITYFRTKDRDLTAIAMAINQFILLINPPEHKEMRSFINSVWKEKEVDDIIEDNCDLLVQTLIGQKELMLLENFSSKLPALTISKIMGIPEEEYEELRSHGTKMVKALDFYLKMEDLLTINDSAKFFLKYFQDKLLKPPASGLIKRIIDSNKERDKPLTDQQITSIFIFLFIAGEETTTSFIAASMYTLTKYNYWNQLTPDSMRQIIDELLRFNGPVHLLGRVAQHDVEINNTLIPKNSTITLCVAAANRDPEKFELPNEFIMERRPRHLAFGAGIHFCLGDWLAKKQTVIALIKLKQAFPKLTLHSEPTWKNQLAIRQLNELNLMAKF